MACRIAGGEGQGPVGKDRRDLEAVVGADPAGGADLLVGREALVLVAAQRVLEHRDHHHLVAAEVGSAYAVPCISTLMWSSGLCGAATALPCLGLRPVGNALRITATPFLWVLLHEQLDETIGRPEATRPECRRYGRFDRLDAFRWIDLQVDLGGLLARVPGARAPPSADRL